jgi:hypothetical protein
MCEAGSGQQVANCMSVDDDDDDDDTSCCSLLRKEILIVKTVAVRLFGLSDQNKATTATDSQKATNAN